MTFDPDTLVMKEDTANTVNLTWPMRIANVSDVIVTSSDVRIIHIYDVIVSTSSSFFDYETYSKNISRHCDVTTVTVLVGALRLGRTELVFDIQLHSNSSLDYPKSSNNDYNELNVTTDGNGTLSIRYPVVVLRNVGMEKALNHIVIHIMVGLLNFAFGCQLEMDITLSYAKKPIAPAIGLCSQFLIMPLVSAGSLPAISFIYLEVSLVTNLLYVLFYSMERISILITIRSTSSKQVIIILQNTRK